MAATERRLIDLLAYPPRGMDVEHAAAYVGLGRTKFLEMVEAGQFSTDRRDGTVAISTATSRT
jgi:hypothetical protein